MTRPTLPPGPPYPDDNEPTEDGRPRFTPRPPSGPQPQQGSGPQPRSGSGPQPRSGSGPQQRPGPGPQPWPGAGPQGPGTPHRPGAVPPPYQGPGPQQAAYGSGPQPPYEASPEPPTYQGLPPYDIPPPPGHAPVPPPPQGAAGYDPYPPPPPAPRPPAAGPSFTPHPPGEEDRQGSRRGRDGKPRPTFTPHPPGTRSRPAPAPTAFFAPVPAGYPQPSFQPFDFDDLPPQRAPRFVPSDPNAPPPPPGAGEMHTAVIDRIPSDVSATGPQQVTEHTQPNLARSSKVMALGTIASRGTGFLRTLVLVIALGQSTLADAYNNSNTLPNTVYYLMLGGIFTSVVVPMLVRAAKEDPDRGEGYARRIYSLGVVSLLGITLVGTALASPIVDLYASNITDAGQHRVMVEFAYFFIPQIFFYGMDSLLGAILNVRGRFGANMWTPVINNVVVIFVALLFMATDHSTSADTASGFGLGLLGIGTTLGIVIQSICLFPVMWKAGFSMRLTFDFRREEIAEIGRMSGWMFGYVATQWLSNLVAQRVANAAANSAAHLNPPVTSGVGFSAWSYAYQLFQLPYAIVGISVISALLPRMSGHATERRYSLVRDDFSKGVRVASVIVVPAAVFLGVLGAPLSEFLFAHGHTTTDQARYIGEVFGAFSVGLVPFMFTQLQLRVFYSFRENRTPAILGMVMLIVGVIGDLVALEVLPPTQTVVGLAFAYDLVTLSGAILAWPLLLRRVGSLDGWRITRSLVRMLLATVPGLVFALVVMAVLGSFMHQGSVYGFLATLLGGGGAVVLYAFCARLLDIEEFRTLMKSVGGRFGK